MSLIKPPLESTITCVVCGEQVPYDQYKANPKTNYCKDNVRCTNLVVAMKKIDKQLKAEGLSFEDLGRRLKT